MQFILGVMWVFFLVLFTIYCKGGDLSIFEDDELSPTLSAASGSFSNSVSFENNVRLFLLFSLLPSSFGLSSLLLASSILPTFSSSSCAMRLQTCTRCSTLNEEDRKR